MYKNSGVRRLLLVQDQIARLQKFEVLRKVVLDLADLHVIQRIAARV